MTITACELKVSLTEQYDQEFFNDKGEFVAFHCTCDVDKNVYTITHGTDRMRIFGEENLKALIEFLQNIVRA